MKFGSVCSGIEAASVAWHPLGWTAAWLSEIEPFPCAVLKHHYPDVPNHGDMTLLPEKILSGQVEAPDLFCGGTPCQAFSVAGLRNSLDDARGNLSLTFVGIANAIDHVRSLRGDAPAIVFWENVPGVLNTKDNAFGCFLGALAGESDPIKPPGERWSNAGCVFGPQRTVAWRVLDAQYFGVAQRRRRVFVVASARDDINLTEILFEFEGVRRDTPQSREKGQRIAPCVTNGPPFSRTGNERVEAEAEAMVIVDCGVELSGPLSARDYKDAGTDGMNRISAKMVPVIHETVGALCADTHPGAYSGQDAYTGRLIPQIVGSVYENHPSDSRVKELGDVSSTVRARWGTGGGNAPMVAQPIAFEPGKMKRLGYGDAEPGLAPTLRAEAGDNQLAVAQPLSYDMKQHHNPQPSNTVQLTTSNCATVRGDTPLVQPMVWDTTNITSPQNGSNPQLGDPCFTLAKGQHPPLLTNVAQPVGVDSYNLCETGNLTQTLKSPQGGVTESIGAVRVGMAVRRLTPVECERLQGFPDNYSNIPWRKAAESPDGPRYKALGNSWAVPVVAWIGKRIQDQLK